jgi:molybdate transport system substrate-binding protein
MFAARRLVLAGLAVAGIAAASCGGDYAPQTSTSGSAVAGSVVVFAASSLTEAFTAIGAAFQVANPDATVTFNFAGSSDLVTQINEGGGNATEPVVAARNTFEIIVGPGNPKGIAGVADLTDPDLIVVLCADTVPCGTGAAEVLANAGVTVTPKSYEEKVKGVVTKVTVGEADTGIVFVTDVIAAGDAAAGVPIPADVNAISNYPIVVTKEAPNAAAAQAFVDFVASAEGQAILAKYGFLPA